jgi:F-type H+-transporting ATPase subunit delta
MRGSSRIALAAATDRIEPLLGTPDAASLGEELFSVARLLDSSAAVRRALSDPSADASAKADLVTRLLSGRVSDTAVDVMSGVVRDRWSSSTDLVDAVEHLGVLSVVAAAEQQGNLDALEDELFRFGRIVDGDAELRRALDDRSLPAEGKAELVERLLEGKVVPQTLVLARQAAAYPRGLRMQYVLEEYAKVAAARRERLVAVVHSAVPLTEAQRDRLSTALARVYGRAVHLDIDVDPEVVGGLRIAVGDEVIDATVLSRLDEARRQLTG